MLFRSTAAGSGGRPLPRGRLCGIYPQHWAVRRSGPGFAEQARHDQHEGLPVIASSLDKSGGTAKVTIDDTVKLVGENESVYIPLGAVPPPAQTMPPARPAWQGASGRRRPEFPP